MSSAAAAGAAAHVFVDDLDVPQLVDDDRHHLARVLRLRAGELVTVSNGAGSWRRCVWTAAGLEVSGDVELEVQPTPAITIGFGLTKGDKPEWVVQKLTELGVDTIVPLLAERSVVRWDDAKAGQQAQRLARVARGAAMQSRRTWLPVVEPPCAPAALATRPGAGMAQLGGAAPSLDRPTLLVGPEGGWTAAEVALAPAVHLGPTVLRAETAAVAAATLIAALRIGLVLGNRHGEW